MYIIMDLDDTLLNKDRKISDYSMNVLKKLQKEGHIIVINTARSFDATKPVIKELGSDYAIMNGGALITKGLDIIYQNPVSLDITRKVLREIVDNNTEEFSIECEKGLLSNRLEYANRNPLATYYDFTKDIDFPAYKILLKSDDGILANELSKKYNLDITHYVGGPWYRLSVCTKHDGNISLYEILEDNNPKSICFGDDLGDIEMLEGATIGVALANSVPKVLEKINIVTKYSHSDDGVARYLEEYFR